MLRELLAPDIQRIKGICAIDAMLQQIILGFGILFCRFVFAETVATAFNTHTFNGKCKVVIV